MNMKVKQTLGCIIQRFKVGDIPKAVAFSMFPAAGTPSAKWSTLNRTIMFLSGTQDARGFKQWKEIGRTIKKDSQAVYILVPNFRKIEDEKTGGEQRVLIGFLARPVFKMEDTEGTPLDYEQIELPELPLAHCGHEKVVGSLAPGQDPFQEIVAELSAQALCCLVGKSTKVTIGSSYKYIERYAEKLNMSAILPV